MAGVQSFKELEARIAELPIEQQRGAAFEVFAEACLATQRVYQAREVWPGNSMPPQLRKQLRLPIADMGVDGVVVTSGDEAVCYQSKFRTGRPALSWSELSTFYGLADVSGRRLVFTNCDVVARTAEERLGAIFVRGCDLDRLTPDDFDIIEAWLAERPSIPKKHDPKPHQEVALNDIVGALSRQPRATALMACGSGKTLVSLWAAERLGARTVLILLPSLALVRQTLHEWLHQTNWPDIQFLCVCSDPTVQSEEDALVVRPSDLDFAVTTQAADVRRFLERPNDSVRLVFSTYQSSQVVAEAVADLPPFDFGVFDEAHKTAGRDGARFALALKDENLPIARRLFLTATPRHYDVAKKDKFGDSKILFSMDVPETYGQVAHRLSFSAAAKAGIITDYKVIISVVTSEMVTNEALQRGVVLVEEDEVKARQVANQIALKSAIEKYNVSKVFTFHSTVNAAKSFTFEGPEGISTHLEGFHCAHIEGAMTTARREQLLREFAAAPRAILSNARCLTEGVDVPAVDMVAFLSPKRSLVDIVQATGRAMRLSPETGKQFGYVLVPLYVEKARGETIEDAVLRSNFDEVWKVLQGLKEQDDLLAQIIAEMRIERGRTGGFDDSRFRQRVDILSRELSLETLRGTITAACLDAIGDQWFERYGQLVAFKQKHGNCDIPARWPQNQKLATWVVEQRVRKRDETLEPNKVDHLNRLGFTWNPRLTNWRTAYLELVTFHSRFGHCRVPQKWKENKPLSHWVATQRLHFSKGKLHLDRIALLNNLGFEWKVSVGTWDERFAELCKYRERYGNTRVPTKWEENRHLGAWVVDQRYDKRRGKLRKDLELRLNAIGFEWEVPRAIMPSKGITSRLDALVSYKAKHGHLFVSRRDKDYPGLACWMTEQRARLKAGNMPVELQFQLDKIDFPWTPPPTNKDNHWFEMFERFKAYADQHGPLTVVMVDSETVTLNRWMLTQRRAKKHGKLVASRVKALDAIGFVWQVNSRKTGPPTATTGHNENVIVHTWDEMFSELVDFFKLHGHSNVPENWTAKPELAVWVTQQRRAKKQNRLHADKVSRMEEVGFAWSTHDGGWDAMFAKLVDHIRPMNNGEPREAPASDELKRWMLTQRQLKRRGYLDPEREIRLANIGFEWEPFKSRWEKMFAELKLFHAAHGHCRVPSGWPKNPVLASWVGVQRARKSAGKLSAVRAAALDALGFTWRICEFSVTRSPQEAWTVMYKQLEDHLAKTGSANVPQVYPVNQKLAWWVTTQRRNRRRGRLTTEQIALLDGLNLNWQPMQGLQKKARSDSRSGEHVFHKLWLKRFEELVRYKVEHGNCRVPSGWSQNQKVANWVGVQRSAYRRAKLSPDRIQMLETIGFDWVLGQSSISQFGGNTFAAEERRWRAMLERLREYKSVHGNCLVPQHWKNDRNLAEWVTNQRAAYKRKLLNPARIFELDEIGFDWDPVSTRWEQMFQKLVDFKNENGHLNVPRTTPEYVELGNWLQTQRAAKRYNRPVIVQRGKRLDEIGFVWKTVERDAWDSMFERLLQFKKTYGHCNVPQRWPADRKLGRWVNSTRHRTSRLKEHQIKQLASIGFLWNTKRPQLEHRDGAPLLRGGAD